MRWLKPFLDREQPLPTLNRWLNTIYSVVLLALAWKIGFSWHVVAAPS